MVGLRTVGGFLTIVVLTTTPVYAQQPAAAGHIKVVTGSAFIVRAGPGGLTDGEVFG
jgi:hypothetical protein